MKYWVALACIFSCLVISHGISDGPSTIDELKALINSVPSNATLNQQFSAHFETWAKLDTTPNLPAFNCKTPLASEKAPRATSVHRLRPEDIDVVAAIGDSITAGCGIEAKTAPGVLKEWRGMSWSIGGDKSIEEGVFTLPNMLKKFNPKVKGYSTGVIPVLTQGIFKKKAGYNMAVSGAKSKGILEQAKNLVKGMSSGTPVAVDMKNDWKLVTIFIGGNDLCAYCKDETKYSVVKYQENLNAAIGYLRDNLPRTLVNVVLMMDLTQLSQANDGFVCGLLHRVLCNCASYPKSEVARQAMIEEAIEYSETVIDLMAKQSSYDKGDDFTVVSQPFLVNQRIPTKSDGKPDLSYFAPDCFHFSFKGHAMSAQGLWNNMFEPAGKKRLSWFSSEGWNCPSATNPYIYTYQNSDSHPYTPPPPRSDGADEVYDGESGLGAERPSDDADGDEPWLAEEWSSDEADGAERSSDEEVSTRRNLHAVYHAGKSAGETGEDPSTGAQSALPLIVGICGGVIMLAVLAVLVKTRMNRTKGPTEKTTLL